MSKKRVGLLYGGRSSEHDISILSARNVYAALAPERHEVVPLYIDPDGRWWRDTSSSALLGDADHADSEPVVITPYTTSGMAALVDGHLVPLGLDVVLPILHGQGGEDGVVQGLLAAAGVAFVGTDVLGSAVCMDKEVAKRLLEASGIPTAPFVLVRRAHRDEVSFQEVETMLGMPVFVKPANSGSSVGVTKVEDEAGFGPALDEAFRFDGKVLVEQAVVGREIEVAVLGNEHPEASVPGEIVSTSTFYDYDAKYTDPDASRMEVPADLPPDVAERVRQIAVETYRVLGCEGLARVDFFVRADGSALLNEVNTMPGFTKRSMYPVMWERSGLAQPALMDRLIALAEARHQRDAAILTKRA